MSQTSYYEFAKLCNGLVPYQFNMWLGNARKTKTPLHHDFHDNLYFLLSGQKEFRLRDSRAKGPKLPLAGAKHMRVLKSNGLITYHEDFREDGATRSAVRDWQIDKLRAKIAAGDADAGK